MKEKDESRGPIVRRQQEEYGDLPEESLGPAAVQPLSTLREGYSWIRALQGRHPGWDLPAVDDAPFATPAKPVASSRVCLVGFAGVYRKGQKPFSTSPGPVSAAMRSMRFRDKGDCSMRKIPSDCEPSELLIAHAHYDHIDGDEDVNCVFPISRLGELELEGFVGESVACHYSMMGYVPEVSGLLETVRREIIPGLLRQGVEAVVTVGGCDLSHLSAGMAQRVIEEAGIPTVGISVCPDLTEGLIVPRAVTLRFPLGNPLGASLDASMQARILRDAISLIDSADEPGILLELPYEWARD